MTEKSPLTNLDFSITKTVAIDLDGCLAHYDEWCGPDHIGAPVPSMVQICHWLHDNGYRVLVNTCRLNKTNNREYKVDTERAIATIREWLNDHDLPFIEISIDDGKPFAHAYVDDRGVSFNKNGDNVERVLQDIQELLKE